MVRMQPYYLVDAFTDRPFAGNPAAVCPLTEPLPDAVMQQVAAEMNLSETAFVIADPGGDGFGLRWMTPTVEVDLCGHATLAAAHVITTELEPDRAQVRFHTRSGVLTVDRDRDRLTMDFPSRPPAAVEDDRLRDLVGAALGATPAALARTANLLAVFEHADEVRALAPDFARVRELPCGGVIATAPGDGGADFVSRYFTPQHGIDEDPVTGSAHCVLAPYWAGRLGKQQLRARQVSRRGGDLDVALAGDRVRLTGQAVLMARGTLLLR